MKTSRRYAFGRAALAAAALWLLAADFAAAHHVLGRPAYGLNEDSNTPPGMQTEMLIGGYLLSYMVFPAFPRPGEPGRINLYAIHAETREPLESKVTFKVRVKPWYSWLGIGGDEGHLGIQSPYDRVFRQRFVLRDPGDYIIVAEFRADGGSYAAEFPLRVGAPPAVGPLGLFAGGLFIALVAVSVFHRRRSMTAKIRGVREGRR